MCLVWRRAEDAAAAGRLLPVRGAGGLRAEDPTGRGAAQVLHRLPHLLRQVRCAPPLACSAQANGHGRAQGALCLSSVLDVPTGDLELPGCMALPFICQDFIHSSCRIAPHVAITLIMLEAIKAYEAKIGL